MTSDKLESFLEELGPTHNIAKLYRQHGLSYGWLAIITISIANVVSLLTGTMINVAIPEIMGAYGIGQDKAQWLSTGFLASSTVSMLFCIWMVNNYGIRNTTVIALLTFMVGSAIGSFSPNTDVMIFARLLQGASAGIVSPLTMSIIFMLFPRGKQGLAMGVSTVSMVAAPALGPTLGGFLVDEFGWRYVFHFGIPFALVCLPAALIYLPDKEPGTKDKILDWMGIVLISLSIAGLLIALGNGQRLGWNSNYILTWAATSAVATVTFIIWELHYKAPLIDLHIFRSTRFAIMSVITMVFGAGLFGSIYVTPLFLQVVQHITPTETGLILMPAGLIMAVIFPVAGRLSDVIDRKLILTAGFAIFAFSCFLMVGSDPNTSFWTFAWWLVIARIGTAMIGPTLNLEALEDINPALLQDAASAMAFTRQFGGAFGVNLLSVALTDRTSFHRDAVFATQSYGHQDSLHALAEMQRNLNVMGLPAIQEQVIAFTQLGEMIFAQAQVYAFQDSFMILAVGFTLSIIPIWLIGKPEHNRLQ